MNTADDVWAGLGGWLGCRCLECEDRAQRFVAFWLDADLRILGTCSVSDADLQSRGAAAAGATLSEVLGESAFAVLRAHLQEALSGGVWSGSFECRGHDETVSMVKIACFPWFAHGDAPVGVQLTIEDKSRAYAQKAAHIALKDRLTIIQENAADAILSINEMGVIESANHAAEVMFGWPVAEIVGNPISMLMPAPHGHRHQEYVDRYLRTGKSGILHVGPREVWGQRRDGSPVKIEISVGEASVGRRAVFIGVCRERAGHGDAFAGLRAQAGAPGEAPEGEPNRRWGKR